MAPDVFDREKPIELTATEPSEEELFYVGLGDQLIKDTLPFLNQVLRQLVTLTVALLAVSVAIYDKEVVHRPLMVVGMVFLLISAILSFAGVLPYGGPITRREPTTIYDRLKQMTRVKSCLAWFAAVPLVLALVVMLVGVIAKNP